MKKIAIFDFDNVIIRGQSQLSLVKFLVKENKISFYLFLEIYFWFLLYRIGMCVSPTRIRISAYKIFKGWSIDQFDNFFRKFNNEVMQKLLIIESNKLINNHLEDFDKVIIVSATLRKIIENILPNSNKYSCIATELEIVDNKYTGLISGTVPFGHDKCVVVKDFIEKNGYDFNLAAAYTDDISDLELLNLVAFPFVVNPDSRLREVANKKGWKIYDFQ